VKRTIIERGSPRHRAWQVAGYLLLLVGIVWVLGLPDFRTGLFTKAVIYGLAVLGLNVVIGFSGQISLGHSAFMGLGAYTSAVLVVDHGWPFMATIPVAAVVGFVVGFLFGIPALRIRGLYLALVTLALAISFPVLVKKFESITGGGNGKTMELRWDPPSWVPFAESENDWKFLTSVAVAAVMYVLVSNMMRSRVGRGLIAMRDNEVGAAVSGVHPATYKVMAFAISAAVGAVAGSLFSLDATITDTTFGFARSIELITGLLIGGIGTLAGAAIGGFAVEFIPYYSSDFLPDVRANILYGAILIALMFVMPGGILWGVRYVRDKFVRFVPRLPRVERRQQVSPDPESAPVA